MNTKLDCERCFARDDKPSTSDCVRCLIGCVETLNKSFGDLTKTFGNHLEDHKRVTWRLLVPIFVGVTIAVGLQILNNLYGG